MSEESQPQHGSGSVSAGHAPRGVSGGSAASTAGSSTPAAPNHKHRLKAPELDGFDAADAPFGASLEPVLRKACDERLSAINWFRTDWQRGGALTGYATYRDADGVDAPVVVKLPVPFVELDWLRRLQDADGLVPRLFAHGVELGAYDIAWVVMERLKHGPLGQAWNGHEFDLLANAAGRFYRAASAIPIAGEAPRRDWEKVLNLSRENVKEHDVAHEQRWSSALKRARKTIREWTAEWDGRACDDWCHGDLHLGNAMSRSAAPTGPAVLFDFAKVHRGNWVEDAVYFEHLFWARRHRLAGRKLCSQIAHERKRHGLFVDPNWPRLASIKRALLAMSVPANLDLNGDPQHVQACLEVLEIEAK